MLFMAICNMYWILSNMWFDHNIVFLVTLIIILSDCGAGWGGDGDCVLAWPGPAAGGGDQAGAAHEGGAAGGEDRDHELPTAMSNVMRQAWTDGVLEAQVSNIRVMSDPKKYFVWEVYFCQKKYIFDPERSTNHTKSSFSDKIIYELPHFWPLILLKYLLILHTM